MKSKLTIFDPSRVFSDSFMDTFFSDSANAMSKPVDIDLYEDDDNVVFKMSAAGYTDKDLDIDIEDNILTVSGNSEQVAEEEDQKKKYYYKGITKQSFTRSFNLPAKIVSEEAHAKIKDGILTITMPKAEEQKAKKININVD